MEKITQPGAFTFGPKSVRLDGTNTAASPTPTETDALENRSAADLTTADLIALRSFFELLDQWDREHHGTKTL